MRHQILKQKQAIAHKTIQPIARLMSIKTEEANERPQMPNPAQTCETQFHHRTSSEEDGENNQRKSLKRTKIELNDHHHTFLHRTIREKEWNIPSLEKRESNKSEKLVGRQSIVTMENTDRTPKPSINLQMIDEEGPGSHYKKDEHIQHLMKVNENLRNLQGKSHGMMLRSIEFLRNNEKHFLPTIGTEDETVNIRKDDSLILLETLEVNEESDSIGELPEVGHRKSNILRSLKEEAALKFKEKIKVKQSRRHIYRTLKSKNDVLNKIKFKSHHCTPSKDRSNPEIRQIQELQLIRVQCPEGKQSNNVRSSNFRSLTKTYYDNMRELRVETKQSSLQTKPTFELRTTKCQFLSNDIESLNNGFKRKTGMEAYEQIALRLKKNQEVSPKAHKNRQDPNKNVFRELTPWHFEQQ